MTDASFGLLEGQHRSTWIRLRTLILLRWVAIFGQITAIWVAGVLYNLQVPIGLCVLAISVSATWNLVAMFVFPRNTRLPEIQNFGMVYFDLLQLIFLLFLTGGLNNPFALLVLGPVVISANVLRLRSTLVVGATALILVAAMSVYHLPLRTEQGFILRMPNVFIFGHWAALTIAILFFSVYSRRVISEINSMSDALSATQLALSREQKLTDLGGVIAAAAHEMGTPLATIKLASSELVEELEKHPELQEDARLISEQADRCRDIMRSMGRAGKRDMQIRTAPLTEVIREAAEPHQGRGIDIQADPAIGDQTPGKAPNVVRMPEIIHGLRNLIQNAVDFADQQIWVDSGWNDQAIWVRIQDDGPGYPAHLINRIGDPELRRRRSEGDSKARPEYEGMGLGLFIAKTLLERTGADLSFANGGGEETSDRSGALVEVSWPRNRIDADRTGETTRGAENPKITD